MQNPSSIIPRTSESALTGLNLSFWFVSGGIILALSIAGVAWPPYSAMAVAAGVPAVFLLIGRPDWAFTAFFASETLISEDILLVTEQLDETIYRISLPYIGLNCFELVLFLLVAITLLQRRGVVLGTRLDLCVIFFGFACLIGYLTGLWMHRDPSRLFEPRRLIHFFVAYYLTVNLIRDKRALRLFLMFFFFAVCLKALQGIYLFTVGEGLMIKWKIRAIFTGWEDSLCFVTFLMMIGAYWIDRTPLPAKRWFILFAPLVMFSFLFSYKRAYYVAFLTGAATLFWIQGGKARFRLIGIALAGLIVMVGLITISGQWHAIGMRIESILNPTQESSANYRLVEWRNAFISIQKHPFLGIGLGGVMPMEIWLSRTNLLGVHNTFLWVAVKMGILGLFCLLFIHFTFLKQLLQQNRLLRDPFLRGTSRGITCALVVFTTAEMFAPMFTQIRTATWLGVFMGLGMLLAELDRDWKK